LSDVFSRPEPADRTEQPADGPKHAERAVGQWGGISRYGGVADAESLPRVLSRGDSPAAARPLPGLLGDCVGVVLRPAVGDQIRPRYDQCGKAYPRPTECTEILMSPTDVRPPFTQETALLKVKMAEAAWNTRDPQRVSLAYTPDSVWRNRDEFFQGRDAIVAFLKRKWAKELDYRLMKELWCFAANRISVRFEYEWHDAAGQWYRSHGNEHWEFDDSGLMKRRDASINDVKIAEEDRRYRV
jgi:nuclear transport factor 2 (NTF2) superfamily protein